MPASTPSSLVASGLPLQEITRTPTLVLVSRR